MLANGSNNFSLNSSYTEYLVQQQVITQEEYASTKVIIDHLSSKAVYLKDVDSATMLKKQMNNLQLSLEMLLGDSGVTAKDREEIISLKKVVDREVLGLNMLK